MDAIQDTINSILEGQIDFHGQNLADCLSTALLSVTCIASFTAGFLANDIFITLWSLLAGGLITALVVVPLWPVYNKNPVAWLPAGGGGGNDINQDAETEKKQGKQIVYENGQVKLI